MKPERILLIDGKKFDLVEENIVIALNSAGVGFITVNSEHSIKGKPVELFIGYNGETMPWFSGYVENDAPIAMNLFKCMVKESGEILRHPLNISERHPTMHTIADIIRDKISINLILPDADYSSKKIPHFKHNGTGIQLLQMLGRCFQVPDYIWYCSVNGNIYAGSYNDCRFCNKPVELPVDFIKNDAGGNGWRIPVIASIRPGVTLNGHRINRVQLINDDMLVTWQDNREPPIKSQIDNLYPEIGAKTHLPRFGRVVAPTEAAKIGDVADPYRPKYAVDVQLLDEDGKPASDTPVYCGVPVPVPLAGAEAGLFQYPPAGTIVELGHVDGRQDKPVIRATHVQEQSLPDIKPGEQLQQQRAEVFQRVHTDGSWQRETDQQIREQSHERHVKHETETREAGKRDTQINSNDQTIVLGKSTLAAGEIQQIADGDYSIAATKNLVIHADSESHEISQLIHTKSTTVTHETGNLTEKIEQIRQSTAGTLQKILAPTITIGDGSTNDCSITASRVWIGSQSINTLTLMLDLCDVVQQLASATASHTHPYVSTPTNAGQIAAAGSKASSLKSKYNPVIK